MTAKRKGNTTNSPRNTEKIVRLSKQFRTEVDEYKRYATERRNNRKYTQEMLADVYTKAVDYLEECRKSHKPMTIAGIMLNTGLNKDVWSKAGMGEYDYLLEEYMALNTTDNITEIDGLPYHINEDGSLVLLIPWSEVVQKLRLIIQDQLEQNLYTNKGNPAGSIFSLKANYQWQEEPVTQHVENTLVIADASQAKKAMAMLLEPSDSNGLESSDD